MIRTKLERDRYHSGLNQKQKDMIRTKLEIEGYDSD